MASFVSPRSFVKVEPELNFPQPLLDHPRALQAGACTHSDAERRPGAAEDMPSMLPRVSVEALHG